MPERVESFQKIRENLSLFHEYRTVSKGGVDSQNGTTGIFYLITLNTGSGQILENSDS
jgi:hypothetical protein